MPKQKTPQNETPSIADEKIIAAIGYLWILFLLPLLLKKESEYCQFHAKQGMVLFITSIVLMVINIIPILGQIIFFLGSITIAVLALLGFVNALQGRKWKLPILGGFVKKINL